MEEYVAKTKSGSFYELQKDRGKWYIIAEGERCEIISFAGFDPASVQFVKDVKEKQIFYGSKGQVKHTSSVAVCYQRVA